MSGIRISRRSVFVGAGAIASTAVVAPLSAGVACPGVQQAARRNVDTLSELELTTYEHAVRLLRAQTQQVLHPLLRQAMTAAQGGSNWDRSHLDAIEARLRATDPARTAAVTIPYWDFTKPPSGKAYPVAFERADSPLFAGEGSTAIHPLDAVFWSYHAYIDTVWQTWEQANGALPHGVRAYVSITPSAVDIRTVAV